MGNEYRGGDFAGKGYVVSIEYVYGDVYSG